MSKRRKLGRGLTCCRKLAVQAWFMSCGVKDGLLSPLLLRLTCGSSQLTCRITISQLTPANLTSCCGSVSWLLILSCDMPNDKPLIPVA